MSKHYETTITCPQCGKEGSFRIWESINTTLDPEMKEKVKDRSAFLFTCPHCGAENYVDYGFLYHQMEDSVMISYCNSDKNERETYRMFTDIEDDPFGLKRMFADGRYLLRIVRSLNALREKIFLFDDGLDDRIIEVYKLFLYVKVIEDVPDAEDAEIFYMGGAEPHFDAVTDSRYLGSSVFDKALYDPIIAQYAEGIPDARHDGPFVDRDYALQLIKSKGHPG